MPGAVAPGRDLPDLARVGPGRGQVRRELVGGVDVELAAPLGVICQNCPEKLPVRAISIQPSALPAPSLTTSRELVGVHVVSVAQRPLRYQGSSRTGDTG